MVNPLKMREMADSFLNKNQLTRTLTEKKTLKMKREQIKAALRLRKSFIMTETEAMGENEEPKVKPEPVPIKHKLQ